MTPTATFYFFPIYSKSKKTIKNVLQEFCTYVNAKALCRSLELMKYIFIFSSIIHSYTLK